MTAYLVSSVIAALAAGLVSFWVTPAVRQRALRWGAAHEPRARDLHRSPVARWGGLVIYVALLSATFLALVILQVGFGQRLSAQTLQVFKAMLFAGTILAVVGALDDVVDIPPGKQMLAQVGCATIVMSFGVRIDFVSHPWRAGEQIYLGGWAYVATVIWIVAVCNAVNWIDGVDGLAAGLGGIASAAIALLAALSPHPALALMASALCGSLTGFLRHNFSPARIFLGGGAPFVGFCLAAMSVAGVSKSATALTLVLPILVLGVPIFDSLFVIVRRLRAGRPIYQADNSHLHHRLLAYGFTPRQTVFILYGISLGLSVAALLLAFDNLL